MENCTGILVPSAWKVKLTKANGRAKYISLSTKQSLGTRIGTKEMPRIEIVHNHDSKEALKFLCINNKHISNITNKLLP